MNVSELVSVLSMKSQVILLNLPPAQSLSY